MKRLAVILLLTLITGPVFAAKGGEKGASTQAYEHASEQSIFNRVSDWFVTIGKSEEEKAKILAERKAKRAQKQAEKELEKAERKGEEIAEEAQATEMRTRERVRQEIQKQQETQAQTKTRERLQEEQMVSPGAMGQGKGKN